MTATTTGGWSWTPPDTARGARMPCNARPIAPSPTRCATGARSSSSPCGRSSARSCTRTCSERTDIETYSEGDEPDRRLVVAPLAPCRRPLSVSRETLELARVRADLTERPGRAAGAPARGARRRARPADHRLRPGEAARIHLADSLGGARPARGGGRRPDRRHRRRRRLSRPRARRRVALRGRGPGGVDAPQVRGDRTPGGRRGRAERRPPSPSGPRTGRAAPGAGRYDVVTARALAPLAVLAEYAAPLLAEGGALVAWKGRRDEAEEQAGAAAAQQLGMAADRVLHVGPVRGRARPPPARAAQDRPDARALPAPARPGPQAAPGLTLQPRFEATGEGLDCSGPN